MSSATSTNNPGEELVLRNLAVPPPRPPPWRLSRVLPRRRISTGTQPNHTALEIPPSSRPPRRPLRRSVCVPEFLGVRQDATSSQKNCVNS